MKTREGFVSNSSSCSFIIHFRNKQDIDEFEKIKSNLFEVCKNASLTITYDLHNLYSFYSNYDVDKDVKINENEALIIDIGDDTLDNIELLGDVQNYIENLPYKFQIYKDELAHYSFGDDIPSEDL